MFNTKIPVLKKKIQIYFTEQSKCRWLGIHTLEEDTSRKSPVGLKLFRCKICKCNMDFEE